MAITRMAKNPPLEGLLLRRRHDRHAIARIDDESTRPRLRVFAHRRTLDSRSEMHGLTPMQGSGCRHPDGADAQADNRL